MTPLSAALTAALLHSLWQNAMIAACVGVALVALRRHSAEIRYGIACAGLAAMLAVPVTTLIVSFEPALNAPVSEAAVADTLRLVASPGDRTPVMREEPLPPSGGSWMATVQRWAVPFWVAGVLVLSVRIAGAGLHARRLLRQRAPADAAVQTMLIRLAARLKITRAVSLVVSSVPDGPATVGWIRPVVFLPPATILGITPVQLEALLAHELAHVRRHDYLVNMGQMMVETLLFYHPGVWWVSSRIRHERELCCDDEALRVCGDAHGYAQALARIAQLRAGRSEIAMAASGGALLARIRRILNSSASSTSSPWPVVAIVVILVTGAIVLPRAQSAVPGVIDKVPSSEVTIRGQVSDAVTRSGVEGVWVRAWHVTGIPVPNRPTGPIIDVDRESGTADHPVYWTQTDSNGRFELRALKPGEYLVSAGGGEYLTRFVGQTDETLPEASVVVAPGVAADKLALTVARVGALAGHILDEQGLGIAGVEVELLQRRYAPGGRRLVATLFAQSEQDGEFRLDRVPPGEYLLRAYAAAAIRPAGIGAVVYAPTFFPAVTAAEEAQLVTIASGQQVLGIDVQLAVVLTRQVAGRLIDPTGQSLSGLRVRLMFGPGRDLDAAEGVVDPNGRFRIADVQPGAYTVIVIDPVDARRWSSASVNVPVDADVRDVTFVATRGVIVRGRITADADARFDPTGVMVMLQPPTPPGTLRMSAGTRGIGADGSFDLNVPPGPVVVQVNGVPRGWLVRSITLDGIDVADQVFDLAVSTDVRRLEIALTRRGGNVTGAVTDRSGEPVPNALVVAFPADRTRWASSRLMRTTFSHQQGRFDLGTIPPADYRIVAVRSLPREAWTDPAVLERLWSDSISVVLREDERREVALKLAPFPSDLLE